MVGAGAAAAYAKTITGTSQPDKLIGTDASDRIRGLGGGDSIKGKAGSGDDVITVANDDSGDDQVTCGSGTDTVLADFDDNVDNSTCEDVDFPI